MSHGSTLQKDPLGHPLPILNSTIAIFLLIISFVLSLAFLAAGYCCPAYSLGLTIACVTVTGALWLSAGILMLLNTFVVLPRIARMRAGNYLACWEYENETLAKYSIFELNNLNSRIWAVPVVILAVWCLYATYRYSDPMVEFPLQRAGVSFGVSVLAAGFVAASHYWIAKRNALKIVDEVGVAVIGKNELYWRQRLWDIATSRDSHRIETNNEIEFLVLTVTWRGRAHRHFKDVFIPIPPGRIHEANFLLGAMTSRTTHIPSSP